MPESEAVLVGELTEQAREWLRGRLDGQTRAVDRATLSAEAVEAVLREHTGQRLMDSNSPLDAATRSRLAKEVTARLLGTGGLAKLLEDDQIEDIWCNGADNVWVRYRDGSLTQVEPVADSDAALLEMVRSIAAAGGGAEQERRFDRAAPILDLQLPGGARLNAVMAVSRRPAVSIRRHRHLRVGLDELVGLGTLSGALAGFLTATIRARCNIVVAGETGAGKTTLLRALCSVLPFEERIVTIEDSFELGLDADTGGHGNVVAMQARAANLEGAGEVGLGQLFRAGLRMNPSRVIVGEVRGAEIIQMLHAMSQGNDGSLSTIHASSSAGAISKLALYALEASPQLTETAVAKLIGEAVDMVVHMRLGPDQVRRVTSVREIKGADGAMVVSNELYRTQHLGSVAAASVPPSKTLADRLTATGWTPERGRVG